MSSGALAIDVRTLPTYTYRVGRPFSRLHWHDLGCWYFSGDGSGRFDPSGTNGMGACYFGEQALCAWIETMRTRKVLEPREIADRLLAEIELTAEITVLDLGSRSALVPGLTLAELLDGEYTTTNAIADEAVAAGLGGVRWKARHDLAGALVAVAFFGPEGAPDARTANDLPRPHSEPIPEDLIDLARREFGYRIVPTP